MSHRPLYVAHLWYHTCMTALPDAVSVTASVAQVKTLADGGIRLSLDLPEDAIDAAGRPASSPGA